jgi:A/G-specific adenine glycosylase
MPTKPALQPLPPKLRDASWKRLLARRLLAWFRRHQRDLPWRRTADPYQIWISEIMLQQTQVATVVPYFERFVAAFPSVQALAEADEHAVLRHWEGLGYYRRARQLHGAARLLVERHQGRFPRSLEAVRDLPGIGRYTAGAIVSIAFDVPAPILEANTVRLFSRLIAFRGDPASSAGQGLLWQVAAAVLPARDRGTFNQALMELGSLVCTARAPRCHVCPLNAQCAAFARGQQDRIPRLRSKPPSEAVREAAVVVWRNDKVLLRRRARGERWAGLWDFLRFPVAARRGTPLRNELMGKVREQSGLVVRPPRRIATLKHTVTRFRITLDCYSTHLSGTKAQLSAGAWQWVDLAGLEDYPLSVTGRKLGRLLSADPPDSVSR